ncbi:ankyrin repeat-containing domain protein [Microdochium trichocladiopsis]|uniref:Ankyrin repeat-containing domain protein n=1 Tax=Microdochium trichocladiopsis TaxID=1682393 RepID=A0A9P8XXN0_9PEZI|nr:ankyrin repeat-containing domain protein [Microdochium trichocladiopsis]KAH7024721.1 ankyrin repeat-containing domain protein [Microdochium trichocladiopsis]
MERLPLHREPHGLFVLHESGQGRQSCKIDIVALHGLGGDAFRTWSDSAGHLWLRDSLPKLIPESRIMSYGYDSAAVFSNSQLTLEGFPLGLLSSLESKRQDADVASRPIVFICHSLGGLLFKQVLITATLSGAEYSDIAKSIRGVVFMGTPHRGSTAANFAGFFSKLISIPTLSHTVGSDLLATLKTNSPTLEQITRQSKHRLASLSIISFFEQKPMGSSLVVEPFSAILGLPNERTISINQDHCDIAREILLMDSTKRCLIVLDALDELSPTDALDVFSRFQGLLSILDSQHPEHQIKIFVSTRLRLSELRASSFTRLVSMNANLTGPGLTDYVKNCVESFMVENKSFAACMSDRTLKQITQKLVRGADGMFLWVVVVWEVFKKGVLWNDALVQRKLRELDSTPAGIDAMLGDMVAKVATDLKPEMWHIFSVMVVARRPLTEMELNILLRLVLSEATPKQNDELDLFRNFGQTIQSQFPEFIILDNDGTFNFVHLSFNHFLQRHWSEIYPDWWNTAHQRMAQACLDYLRFEDLVAQAQAATSIDEVFFEFPLLDYAMKFSFDHLQHTDDKHDGWLAYAKMGQPSSIFANPRLAPRFPHISPLNAVIFIERSPVLVRRFAQSGYDLDDKWNPASGEWTAFQRCVFAAKDPGMMEMAELLLELGANPDNLGNSVIETALQTTIRARKWDLFGLLMKHDRTDPNRQNMKGETALHFLVRYASADALAKSLASETLDINAQDVLGYTPLHVATHLRSLQKIKILLQTPGIKIDIVDKRGRTPLASATYWGYADAAKVLIGLSTASPLPDSGHLSALICAFALGDKRLAEMMLDHSGHVGLKAHLDLSGKSVLHHAALNDWAGIIQDCVFRDSDGGILNHIDHSGSTALHYAAARGNTRCVQVLKSLGASSIIQDRNGRTAAQAALDAGFKDTVIALLNHGDVDVDQADHQGRSLMHWAASLDCVDVMEMVLGQSDAGLFRRDNMSLLPVDIAFRCSCARVGRYLTDKMKVRFPAQAAVWTAPYDWNSMYQSPEVTTIEEYWTTDNDLLSRQAQRQRNSREEWEALRQQYPEHLWAVVVRQEPKPAKDDDVGGHIRGLKSVPAEAQRQKPGGSETKTPSAARGEPRPPKKERRQDTTRKMQRTPAVVP